MGLTASRLGPAVPAGFVLLWSTGFIGAKLGLPDAGPLSFLTLRFGLVTAAMIPVALLGGARWPVGWRQWCHVVIVGLLMQWGYIGGVFLAIASGVPAGIVALIVGLQPLLTAALAHAMLGERVGRLAWLGLGIAALGAAMVVANPAMPGPARLSGIGMAVGAMLAITLGTLYQKRFCAGFDLRAAIAIQNAAAAALMLPLAVGLEGMRVRWTPDFIFALGWLSLGLSVGASMLLFHLLRQGAAARVVSLFYLVPGVTALMAWAGFGEALTALAVLGMATTACGVALANRR
jgi:drug/metabolite transporter (DMT)-like permease